MHDRQLSCSGPSLRDLQLQSSWPQGPRIDLKGHSYHTKDPLRRFVTAAHVLLSQVLQQPEVCAWYGEAQTIFQSGDQLKDRTPGR